MTKRLMIKVSEYEVKDENGAPKTKGEYVRLGVILSGDNGEYALIDPTVNIAGCLMKQRVMNQGKQSKGKGDMVMCSIFTDEPQQRSQQDHPAHQQGGGAAGFNDFDDDIPYMRIADKSLYCI